MKKALFIAGGWDGHRPERIVQLFAGELNSVGFTSDIESSLDVLTDGERLKQYDVIFPCWTMGSLSKEQTQGLVGAVRGGVGLAGVHGGMGDAFRGNHDFEWMVGGHFVGHPHVGDYVVRVTDVVSEITRGLPPVFAYKSEQYYMLVDPGVQVLADTEYTWEGRRVTMPVAWARRWGKGRVFYSALGHDPDEFTRFPEARVLTVQGVVWAATRD